MYFNRREAIGGLGRSPTKEAVLVQRPVGRYPATLGTPAASHANEPGPSESRGRGTPGGQAAPTVAFDPRPALT